MKTIGAALLILGAASVLSSAVTIGSVGGALHLIGSIGIMILGHDNAIIGRNIWKHYLHPKKTRLLERTHSIENLTREHARLPRNWDSIYKKYQGAIGRGVFSTLNPNLVHDKQTRDVVLEFWLGETLLLYRLAKMWVKIGKFS